MKLKKIFDCSLDTGLIPKAWKHATIIPLQKDGNKKDVNNLRPISLLPLPGKILEKIIQKNLSQYLETNNIFDSKQGGFRPKHSTTNSIVNLTEDIYCSMNNKEYTTVVYIDLKKAFDTVNHKIVLQKLEKAGVGIKLKMWFSNYLTDRTQCTYANDIESNVLPLACGVPQGSVLGPTLFLIYINDVKDVLKHANHMLYADDTALYLSGNDLDVIEYNLQEDLNRFSVWCKQNVLTVNVQKTKYVIYGTSQMLKKARNLKFSFGNILLIREHYYKYLGMFLDATLSFNKHIDFVNKVTSHKIFTLSKIRNYIDQRTALYIFKSMVCPIFDYGDIIYEGGNTNRLEKLKRTQNRGLKICMNIFDSLMD